MLGWRRSSRRSQAIFSMSAKLPSGEIRYGIEQIEEPSRRADIQFWLDHTIRPLFAGNVTPVNEDVIVRWKMMVVHGQKRGHTFGQPDLFIAAIAALEELVVVSRALPFCRRWRAGV